MPLTRAQAEWQVLMSTPGSKASGSEFEMALQSLMQAAEELEKQGIEMSDDELEVDDKMLLEADLSDLAQAFVEHLATLPNEPYMKVTLHGPMQLTIQNKNLTYAKAAHIGGEEFKPVKAHIGKRGRMIIDFAPLQAAAYDHVEMYVEDAVESFEDFATLFAQFPDGTSLTGRLADINRNAAKLREREKNRDKFNDYDAFGTF